MSDLIRSSIFFFQVLSMPGRDDYERFFRDADTDESGTLTLDELVTAFRKACYGGTDEQLKVITYVP